ncbi:MAG: protein-L-isoaspartate O-methyltransferase [Gammaproteobacteria bacterium]|jgi:protein-L-isoaspartate(D-aspartate) O-methyltransferase|nr:protein-L-isoaspartate O-methyltransferase [Gammaproteobacteria bacterium]
MNFLQARSNMVAQQVRPWHVINDNVLTAMLQIPRENFVPLAFHHVAYSDTDIPLSEGHTMLPPKVVGRALQALELTGVEKVLEVGTGTGYVTACLTKLAGSVVSIEIQPTLLAQAQMNLDALNCRNLTLLQGDAVFGWEDEAPFDAIFVTGSYPLGVPEQICAQLKTPGRLFAFTGLAPTMRAVLIERFGKNDYTTNTLFETVVPALIHAPQPKAFQF